MSAGHENEVFLRDQKEWVRAFLNHPVPHQPGTVFRYNTPATFMQSAIVQKVTGKTWWIISSRDCLIRWGLKTTIGMPILKEFPSGVMGYMFGQKTSPSSGSCYLQKGKWEGKQLIPEHWIVQATSRQVPNGTDPDSDWAQGYGFQFWQCRHGAYRGDGKDGQFCIVLPEQDAVVAITANAGNMQAELNVVWEQLLPAFHDGKLEEDAASQEKIKTLVSTLKARR